MTSLQTVDGAERRRFVCRTPAGHELELDVIGASEGARRPCLMWIHGGGLIFGSRTLSPRPFLVEALLAQGFVIAAVDHRLAPEALLEEICADIQALWHWIHAEGPALFGADPDKLCIAGASAGGYLALQAASSFAPQPRALASLWGFGDITAPWEAEPSEHYRAAAPLVTRAEAMAALSLTALPTSSGEDRSRFYLYCRQQGLWLQEVTGHGLPEGLDWLRRYCPLLHIGPDFPPTFLVHGLDDKDVPASESERLVARLREQGVHHEFHALPGVGHGFARAPRDLVEATELALARFLRAQIDLVPSSRSSV